MVNEPFSRGDEPIDKGLWSLYKPSNGFNLTQNELDQIFSAVKSKVKKEEDTVMSSTEKKLDALVYRVLARADIDQEAPMLDANGGPPLKKKRTIQMSSSEIIITDENGMTGFAPLP